jgi:hypothetical protein
VMSLIMLMAVWLKCRETMEGSAPRTTSPGMRRPATA